MALILKKKTQSRFPRELIASKELCKNLPAIKHVESERAKSNKELAAPVPYYILLVMLTGRCSPEIRTTFHGRRLLVVQLLLRKFVPLVSAAERKFVRRNVFIIGIKFHSVSNSDRRLVFDIFDDRIFRKEFHLNFIMLCYFTV